jgi:hypothetical protein
MSGWTIAWLIWIGAFCVIEGAALARKQRNDTLSEHVWRWFKVGGDTRPTPLVWLLRLPLIVGGVWLTMHLTFGIWSF